MAIVKRGEKWCVTESDRKTVIKCHPSRKAAVAQLAAIEADKAKRKKGADVRTPFIFHLAGKHDQSAHAGSRGKRKPPSGQVSFEAQPSTSLNPVPGIQDATFAEKRGYMKDAVGAMGNPETGAPDEMLEASGMKGEAFEAVGVWKGEFNPGMQVEIADDASQEEVESYAAGVGKTLKQDAVGYHRPFYDGNQANDQGAELELGSTINKEQMGNLYTELGAEVGTDKVDDIALVSSKKGVRALNFSDIPPEEFQQSVANAAGRAFDQDVTMGTFDFKGGLVDNDWKANPNGEGYDSKIAKGSRDFQRSVERVNERVGKVNEQWKQKLGEGGQTPQAASERRHSRKRGAMAKEKDKDKLNLKSGKDAEGNPTEEEDDKKAKAKGKKKPPQSYDDETKITKLFMKRFIALMKKALPESEVEKAMKKARSSAGGEMKKRKAQDRKAASEGAMNFDDYEGMWSQRKAKDSVNYTDASSVGEQCSMCRFFLGGACRLVEGTIFPDDVCDLFEEKVAFFSEDLIDLCAGTRCNSEFSLFNELKDFAEPPEWIPFLPKPGEYNSPRYGEIVITRERNEHFIENFEAGVYQEALPISSEHIDADQEGAYGWIEEMRMNEDGSVDARVSWTDRGKEAIEKDRFRYFSPEFHDVYKDNKGQKHRDVAVGGALTTRPFFKEDELRPLVASEGVLTFGEGDHSIQFTTAPKAQKGKSTMQTSAKGDSGAGASKEPGKFKKFAEGLVGWMKKFGEEEGIELDGLDEINASLEGSGEGEGEGAGDGEGTPASGTGTGDGTPVQASERIAALEAENAKLKASEKANATELKKASDRISKLEANEDAERFREIVAPRDNPDARWFGDTEGHIKHLMALKKAFGEDSEEFKHYVSQNQATVVATNTAGLFDERGHLYGADAEAVDPKTPGGAYAKLREHAHELQEFKEGKITEAQAIVKASELHPELKQAYRKQFRSRETVR